MQIDERAAGGPQVTGLAWRIERMIFIKHPRDYDAIVKVPAVWADVEEYKDEKPIQGEMGTLQGFRYVKVKEDEVMEKEQPQEEPKEKPEEEKEEEEEEKEA